MEHLLPAYAVDAILYILFALNVTKHKPFLVRLIGKMHNGMAALEWFANRQWIWANDNVVALEKELNTTDREAIQWKTNSGLKKTTSLRFHFDPFTQLNYPFLHSFQVKGVSSQELVSNSS